MSRGNRREEILQALALMLETQPGSRITTAALAREVGVSEAALYRHFPSKAKMLESLIEFIEESLFSRIGRIMTDEPTAQARCGKLLTLLLTFAERNPGMSRLLVGDALQGETERLRARMRQLLDRIETQLRQILRELALETDPLPGNQPAVLARVLMTLAEGQIAQFVRSDFKQQLTEQWDDHWQIVRRGVFGA